MIMKMNIRKQRTQCSVLWRHDGINGVIGAMVFL